MTTREDNAARAALATVEATSHDWAERAIGVVLWVGLFALLLTLPHV